MIHLSIFFLLQPPSTMASPADSIPAFYTDRALFITGATGFMGKVLVEKLLRSCPAVRKLYLLVRPKKGQSPQQRVEDFLNCKVGHIVLLYYWRALDCWSTGQVIDPAPGAWFITKFISFTQVVPGPVLQVQNHSLKHHFISYYWHLKEIKINKINK